MRKKKLFIFCLFLLLFVSSVTAVSFRDASTYSSCYSGWTLNQTSGTLTDICARNPSGGFNLTTTGLVSNTTNCAFGNCWGWTADATDNAAWSGTAWALNTLQNYTICGWFYANSVSGDPQIFGIRSIAETVDITLDAGTTLSMQARAAPSNDIVQVGFTTVRTWTHICMVRGNTTLQGWLNGVNFANDTSLGSMAGASNTGVVLGNHPDLTGAPFNGQLDDWVVFTNRTLSRCEIIELYNGSCTPPAAITAFSITAADNVTGAAITVLNATINGVQYSSTNGTINTPYNTTSGFLNISVTGGCSAVSPRLCDWSTVDYSNHNTSANLQASLRYFYYTNVTALSSISEYQTQSITLKVNNSVLGFANTIEDISASLIYNGTLYHPTETQGLNFTLFNATFLTPTFSHADNVSYYWMLNITRQKLDTGVLVNQINYTNITGTQAVFIIGVDNCSTLSTLATNITLKNENDSSIITGFLEGYFQVYISSQDSYRAFNLTWANSTTFGICISPPTATYNFYAQTQYGASGFATETYYFTNSSLNSVTDFLDFYLTPDATLVTFTVKDENDNLVSNAYIVIQAFDLATNTATTTEILRTGNDGTAIGHIKLNTQRYKFIILYNGEVKYESDEAGTILTGTSYSFRITLGSDVFLNYQIANGVSCSLTFDNSTKTFTYVFADPTGNVAQGCLDVTKFSGTSSSIANSSCVSSSSGTVQATISNNTGTYTFVGAGTIEIDDNIFSCGNATSYSYDRRFEAFNLEGLFYAFFLILTLVMIGQWAPVASIVFMILGLILTVFIGLIELSYPILAALVIVLGIYVYKVSR